MLLCNNDSLISLFLVVITFGDESVTCVLCMANLVLLLGAGLCVVDWFAVWRLRLLVVFDLAGFCGFKWVWVWLVGLACICSFRVDRL